MPRVPALAAIGGAPLALILGCAGIARLLAVLASPHYAPHEDALDYDRMARSIAAGHGYPATTFAAPGTPSALRPPLYPYLLAAVYRASGGSITAGRLAGALLGVVSVALVYLIGREGWSRRVGLIAAALAALFPPLVFSSSALLSESLFLPFELSAVLAVLVIGRRATGLRWAAAVGALCGVAALVRPVGLPLALAAAVGVSAAAPRRRLASGLVVLAAAVVVIAPWTIRSSLALHHFVPVSTQDGITAYGTYNAHAQRDRAIWQVPTWLPEVTPLLPRMNEAQLDALLGRRALDYAVGHASYALEVLGLNTLRLAALGPEHSATTANSYVELSVYGWLRTLGDLSVRVLVVLAAGSALLLVVRRRRRPPAVVWLAPLVLFVSVAVINSALRFRTPVDPFLLLLVAVGADAVRGRVSAPALAAQPGDPRDPVTTL